MDSITISSGDLSKLTPDEFKQGLKNLSKALKRGLPPGMEAVINTDLPDVKMPFSYPEPIGARFLALKADEEERRHKEFIEAIRESRQHPTTQEPATKNVTVNNITVSGDVNGSITIGNDNQVNG